MRRSEKGQGRKWGIWSSQRLSNSNAAFQAALQWFVALTLISLTAVQVFLTEMGALFAKCQFFFSSRAQREEKIVVSFSWWLFYVNCISVWSRILKLLIGMNSTLKPTFCCSPLSPWSRCKSVSWPHPRPEYVCIALQIGRLVGMTGFWHFSCAGPVIIVPSCCFSVGCDLSLGTVPPPPPPLPSVVQLADSDTVVLMTHCFAWGHREEFTFFPRSHILCNRSVR